MDLTDTADYFKQNWLYYLFVLFLSGLLFWNFLELEAAFLLHKDMYSFIAVMIAICVTLTGWLFNNSKARDLQRKQLAISLLNDNRYQSEWVNAKHQVWVKIHEPEYGKEKWTALLKDGFNPKVTLCEESGDLDLWRSIRLVMNSFEFVAMAVNCKAANKYIVSESWEVFYSILYRELIDGIKEVRKLNNDEDIWINFTTLAVELNPSLVAKTGQPSTKVV